MLRKKGSMFYEKHSLLSQKNVNISSQVQNDLYDESDDLLLMRWLMNLQSLKKVSGLSKTV